MNVLVVEPGYLPYEKEINGLEEMQAVVGGLIEPIYPYEERVALVGNEESLLMGLPFNRSVPAGYERCLPSIFNKALILKCYGLIKWALSGWRLA